MASLLDDALADIRDEKVARALEKTRIGNRAKDACSVASAIQTANAYADKIRGGPADPHNNFAQFVDGGYMAKVIRQTCNGCHSTSDYLVGLFHIEHHVGGGRRLTKLGKGAQWPLVPGHAVELTWEDVDNCSTCLSFLGFDKIETSPPVRTIVSGD